MHQFLLMFGQAITIFLGLLVVGYLFGLGFSLALKHSKIAPLEVHFTANIMQQPGEEGPADDSGPELSGGLKGYYRP